MDKAGFWVQATTTPLALLVPTPEQVAVVVVIEEQVIPCKTASVEVASEVPGTPAAVTGTKRPAEPVYPTATHDAPEAQSIP